MISPNIPDNRSVAAIVLAAGLSTRMGQPKLVLPWGTHTVIEQVIKSLNFGGISEVVVVTGGAREQVEDVVRQAGAKAVFNPKYSNGEMLDSIQVGLSSLGEGVRAGIIALGDQPQILESTVKAVLQAWQITHASLVIPSYDMHRGHPWLVERHLWKELLRLRSPQTLRDFINSHQQDIHYTIVDTPTILDDLDTHEQYLRQKPK